MPRTSKRKKLIKELTQVLEQRAERRMFRMIDSESDSDEDVLDLLTLTELTEVENSRYIDRRKYRTSNQRFQDDLREESDDERNRAWLTDDEFLQKYRMSRENFHVLLNKIKDHEVFNSKGRRQAEVSYQLMVFLKYIGTAGSGQSNANQRHTFGIGYGTAMNYLDRVTTAVLSLVDEYYHWPDEEERKDIAQSFQEKFDFPHCVGVADGTLFPLAFEPQSDDAPDYSGRKHAYSLSTMIICDHTKRIRHYLAGFPGSAHDNRIFKSTKLAMDPDAYFDKRQYILGDSAFENQWFMVSAFKRMPGAEMNPSHDKFNKKLAKARICSEHCIGMLKGRFQWLKGIRMVIRKEKKYLRRILRLIEACVILHNMLIDLGEATEDDWIEVASSPGIPIPELAANDVLNTAIPEDGRKDERRTRLMYYFEEHCYF